MRVTELLLPERRTPKDRYVGLDGLASSCTLGVVGPSGKRLGSHVVETNAKALIEVLRGIPRPRHLCLEEGTLVSWLSEVLSPHVEADTVVFLLRSQTMAAGESVRASQRAVHATRGREREREREREEPQRSDR